MWFVWSSGAWRIAPHPSPHRGATGVADDHAVFRRTVARSRGDAVSRRSLWPSGAIHGGRSPIDSAAVGLAAPLLNLRCCARALKPLRATVALEVLTIGVRHMRKHARASLLTLTPTFPSRPDPCGPTLRPDCLSWGFQRSPLHRTESKSPTPGFRVSTAPFGARQPVSPACRPRGFAPPRRVVPLRPCRSVSPCCRSWGSPYFFPSRNGPPYSVCPALRSFSPADSDRSGTSPPPWARVTESTIAGRLLHRSPCPLTLLSRRPLPASARSRQPEDGASRPCSIVGSVADAIVSVDPCPMLPWAWSVPPAAARIPPPPLLAEWIGATRARACETD